MGHYQQFIKGLVQIAKPLNEHLAGKGTSRKSEQVLLSEDALGAFQALKQACMSAPILTFADYTKEFLLKTDTSKEGLGAVLSQKQEDGWYHPVTYGSSWKELSFYQIQVLSIKMGYHGTFQGVLAVLTLLT